MARTRTATERFTIDDLVQLRREKAMADLKEAIDNVFRVGVCEPDVTSHVACSIASAARRFR